MRGIALAAVAVLAFGATGAAATYAKLQGNIDQVDVSSLVGERPSSPPPNPDDPSAGQPVNFLVLGSDERDGENGEIGGHVGGMRSDTTMVVHISADRSRVEVVSIPRDSLVPIPSCTMSNGSTTPARRLDMFNSAFATGWDNGGDIASAAACTIKTVQESTGLWIDHFVVVDFAGFQRMVDAIGGVSICIPNDMHSEDAKLDVKAGEQVLDGPTALAFARARKGEGVGDGSDINRIGNQQRLVAAMVTEVMSKNVLTDVPQLIRFLSAATDSLTIDNQLSLNDLAGLAYNMRDIRSGNITFVTIPWAPAPSNPNRVVWKPEAATIWANLAADVPALGEPDDTTPDTGTPSNTPTSDSPTSEAPTGDTSAPSDTPTPQQTKKAGRDAFSPDDVTAVCAS